MGFEIEMTRSHPVRPGASHHKSTVVYYILDPNYGVYSALLYLKKYGLI